MPATEQTWRNQKTLHVVFAATGVILLFSTILMFAKDHDRQWKRYQDRAKTIDLRMTEWRTLQVETDEVVREHDRLQSELAEARSRSFSRNVIDQFMSNVQEAAEGGFSFASLESRMKALEESAAKARKLDGDADQTSAALQQDQADLAGKKQAAEAAEAAAKSAEATAAQGDAQAAAASAARDAADLAKKAVADAATKLTEARAADEAAQQARMDAYAEVAPLRERVIGALTDIRDDARFREDETLRRRKFTSADLDAAKGTLGLGVRDQLDQSELDRQQTQVDELKAHVEELDGAYEGAAKHRTDLDALLNELSADEDRLAKDLEENRAELNRIERALIEQRKTYFVWGVLPGKRWLELPILDAFNSPLKIENLWSEGLEQRYGSFGLVRRFDRCTTCHQATEKTLAGSAVLPAYEPEQLVDLRLDPLNEEDLAAAMALAKKEHTKEEEVAASLIEVQLEKALGLVLAYEGLVQRSDVVIKFVKPKSQAAQARFVTAGGEDLMASDVQIRNYMLQPSQDELPAEIVCQYDAFPLSADLDVTIRGNQGTQAFHWTAETELEQIVAGINAATANTGVTAEASRDDELVLRSTMVGPKAVIAVDADEVKSRAFLEYLSKPLAYGIDLSPPNVLPGMRVGDAIVEINGDPVKNRSWVISRLLSAASNGESLTIRVRRGLPHPFATHPRLDLFVGSLSPHKVSEFGCTICHDGQGSATDFKWVSHTPDNLEQRHEWSRRLGWFDNHHWINPMFANRFTESGCLKCHHSVTELEASKKYPEAPAPKLTRGDKLIAKYGCYGCHEINGFDGPNQRVGPDMRLEPNYFAAAQQFLLKPHTGADQLTDLERTWVERVIESPEDAVNRRKVMTMMAEDVARATERGELEKRGRNVDAASIEVRFSKYTRDTLAPLFSDNDTPGTMRKVGPSLRFVSHKLGEDFLFDWIRDPKNFRPSTKMPQFFGQWFHLEGDGRSEAERFEPIEIQSMVKYLLHYSQKYSNLHAPEGITPVESDEDKEAQIERGRVAFLERGCLACHTHDDFPDLDQYRAPTDIVQGPDLSGISDKFDSNKGREWLYSWLKQPTRYHVRTVMPDLFLAPIEIKEEGSVVAVVDPAADIAAYLMSSSRTDWEPVKFKEDPKALEDLAMEHLGEAFYQVMAKDYYEKGIPESLRDDLKGAETEMIVTDEERAAGNLEQVLAEKRLLYIGRRSLAKYGCYACHDIPGFEDAKPIATALADWGRKEPEKLAFEHIWQYLEHGHGSQAGEGHGNGEHSEGDAEHADDVHPKRRADAAHPDNPHPRPSALPNEFFMMQLESGNRIGFIFQKLLEPRSYDYHKTENKRYNERLRMPRFSFDDDEREAVITYVLGLVADPPRAKYVYKPDKRQADILAGKRVLQKFNCGGCHVLEAERWELNFPAGSYADYDSWHPGLKTNETFPVTLHRFKPEEIAESAKPDYRDRNSSTLFALPLLSNDDARPMVLDDEELPLEEDVYDASRVIFQLQLYAPTVIDGMAFQVSDQAISVPSEYVQKRYGAHGGLLRRYLLPKVFERIKRDVNPQANGRETWGWVPPPLIGEGSKVNTDWLHDFLLDPYIIRPSVVLRMPRFNMSTAEASKLVNYFAAIDNVTYPYEFSPEQRKDHLAAASERYEQHLLSLAKDETHHVQVADVSTDRHLDDAMNIVVDKAYCRQCHIVADYRPDRPDKAPDLSRVQRRLRSDYVRRWIGRPTSILPYTNMPINVAYNPDKPFKGTAVPQRLYHGTSVEQLDALVDLLMNYDIYTKTQTRITPLVKKAEAEAPPAEATTGDAAAAESED